MTSASCQLARVDHVVWLLRGAIIAGTPQEFLEIKR
jgi:hypothetical protein